MRTRDSTLNTRSPFQSVTATGDTMGRRGRVPQSKSRSVLPSAFPPHFHSLKRMHRQFTLVTHQKHLAIKILHISVTHINKQSTLCSEIIQISEFILRSNNYGIHIQIREVILKNQQIIKEHNIKKGNEQSSFFFLWLLQKSFVICPPLFLINLTQAGVIWKERPQSRNYLQQSGLKTSLWGHFPNY